jgi:hypothetical protein
MSEKIMVKKQQMRWNRYTIQKFLDVRIHVLRFAIISLTADSTKPVEIR